MELAQGEEGIYTSEGDPVYYLLWNLS